MTNALDERPTPVRTPDMIETIRELISTDRRITLRMMEEELEISREIIRIILMKDF
jgi:Mn-dependent DtxR family transcriptional regulator